MRRAGFRVVGLDASSEMLEVALMFTNALPKKFRYTEPQVYR